MYVYVDDVESALRPEKALPVLRIKDWSGGFFRNRIDNCPGFSVESWKRIAALDAEAGKGG